MCAQIINKQAFVSRETFAESKPSRKDRDNGKHQVQAAMWEFTMMLHQDVERPNLLVIIQDNVAIGVPLDRVLDDAVVPRRHQDHLLRPKHLHSCLSHTAHLYTSGLACKAC
jgi:hypothetical protein